MGEVVPTIINVYDDRSFDFVIKTTPASRMIIKAINKDKGSQKPGISKGGEITLAQCREIAEAKMADLNATDLDQATKIIAGTARSMGVEVK